MGAFLASPIAQALAASLARTLLTAVGGIIIGKGYMSGVAFDQLVGAGAVAISQVWSAWSKAV